MDDEIKPGGCMHVFIYHRQDIQNVAKCGYCLEFLKVGNHFGYFCDLCDGKGFICSDCMKNEIVKIAQCYGGSAYYAMEGEKIISYDQSAFDAMLFAGEPAHIGGSSYIKKVKKTEEQKN